MTAKCLLWVLGISLAILPCTAGEAKAKHSCCYEAPQYELGQIYGRVMGGLVPVDGANVVLLLDNEVVAATVTDEDGNYHFNDIDAAHYDIKLFKDGYRTRIITQVPVRELHRTIADTYLPKFNNSHMAHNPIVERYEYSRKYVRELQREDYKVYYSRNLE